MYIGRAFKLNYFKKGRVRLDDLEGQRRPGRGCDRARPADPDTDTAGTSLTLKVVHADSAFLTEFEASSGIQHSVVSLGGFEHAPFGPKSGALTTQPHSLCSSTVVETWP
jgi:hypothetical protein